MNKNIAIALSLGCYLCVGSNMIAVASEEKTSSDGMMEFNLDTMTVEAKRPDWETKLSPGSVTVIKPDDYKGERKSLPDLLRKVPGIHVREVNGKGQYTTVSVRGSTAAQVGVFVDGVMTNLGGDAAVDIFTIPIDNVERVEVYRGYIPSRFAGTFIGGVINIVTKKPDKPHVATELGKSAYGGKKASVEVVSPFGSGSLMIGASYDASDGDFKYKNYATGNKKLYQQQIEAGYETIANFNNNMIDIYGDSLGLSNSEMENYKKDNNAWIDYLHSEDGFFQDYDRDTIKPNKELFVKSGLRDKYIEAGYTNSNWYDAAIEDYYTNDGVKKYAQDYYIKDRINQADPDSPDNKTINSAKESIKDGKKKLKYTTDTNRWRKYNDYKKTNMLLKWQDENWVIKGSWNTVDRHMPDSLWGGAPVNAHSYVGVDVDDMFTFDARRQKIDNKELMIQNRKQIGKLDFGWLLDYTHSDKSYRAEHIADTESSDFEKNNIPLREWSKYKSDKYNAQIDGSMKMSDNNMLDFQMNYSHEKMNVDGSLMDKVLGESDLASVLGQTRNRYEQDLLNIQLQDSITLDKDATWYLTPSIRYNRSTITGYSDGERFKESQSHKYGWIHEKDKQTNDKVTWQLALKKEFNNHFTMRMTGGTYYRLLNMYEIAGDGAGVLPAPHSDARGAVFPLPEDGKQFDISAIWDGKVLGGENKTTLTYFWRDTDNMLQLVRCGKDYWSYLNDNRGKVHGFELQSNFNWNKFDLDLQATYMKTHAQQKNSSPVGGYDYIDIWQTYQPEWEGNIRLSYSPTSQLQFFTEAHYTDQYFTDTVKDTSGGDKAYLSGKPVEDLLVFNGGAKVKLNNRWQLTLGCNDIFNAGPKVKVTSRTFGIDSQSINSEFPLQGRTWYVTARYEF